MNVVVTGSSAGMGRDLLLSMVPVRDEKPYKCAPSGHRPLLSGYGTGI